jgi:hypothetical protein
MPEGEDKLITEDMSMRAWWSFAVFAALTGCSGKTIDTGTNDAGGVGSQDDTGAPESGAATMVATDIQVPVVQLLSDGATLFWVDETGILSSMPVGGGPIKTLLTGEVDSGIDTEPQGTAKTALLSVDSVSVYLYQIDTPVLGASGGGAILSIPKEGSAPVLISETGAPLVAATSLAADVYWLEVPGQICPPQGGQCSAPLPNLVKSSPLRGGPISVVTQFDPSIGIPDIAVTATTVFLPAPDGLLGFPTLSGVPDGGIPPLLAAGLNCKALFSDTDAIYCYNEGSVVTGPAPITRVASDGTTTTLGMTINAQDSVGAGFAFDDTYVYWVDDTTVGTIMKAPKTGGTATVVARDTNPIAVAVDATSVYWSNIGGEIRRLAK